MKLINGDCLEYLTTIPDGYVDALITDPPAGIGFMGNAWDHSDTKEQWISYMKSILSECKRVMKPGAYGLVWALPRTSHWTATALEDAGFDIRDIIHHIQAQGFPKSLNVEKQIRKINPDIVIFNNEDKDE